MSTLLDNPESPGYGTNPPNLSDKPFSFSLSLKLNPISPRVNIYFFKFKDHSPVLMAFVVVVLFYSILFYIYFKRLTFSSFKPTCGEMANDEAIDLKLNSRCACRILQGHWGSRREILSIRHGPLEKLWGVRWGIFEPQEFFFVIKFLHEFQF